MRFFNGASDAALGRLLFLAAVLDSASLFGLPATQPAGRALPRRPDAARVVGNVVDDRTGKPVEKFLAIVLARRADEPSISWPSYAPGSHGQYDVPIRRPGDEYVVRIECDDYLPVESQPLADAPSIEFNARLKHGTPINGTLLKPNGRPAAGADVVMQDIFTVRIDDGWIAPELPGMPGVHRTLTDEQGHFELPPSDGRVRVFAANDSGWGEWLIAGQGPAGPVTMQEWSTVEGTITEGGKPAAHRTVRLTPVPMGPEPARRMERSVRGRFQHEAITDPQGHFIIGRVIDGMAMLSVEAADQRDPRGMQIGLTLSLDLEPGEHRVLRLGDGGRAIVGKVVIPENLNDEQQLLHGALRRMVATFTAPKGYENMTEEEQQKVHDEFKKSPECLDLLSKPTGYGVTIHDDGTFRADDVQPGEYVLSFSILGSRRGAEGRIPLIASVRKVITVPEGGAADQPLNVSDVTLDAAKGRDGMKLRAFKQIKAGEVAPEFEALTFDGKRVKLSDLRGKYVLLDFWATWCGGCVAQMKDLEALHDRLKNDPRLVMISISLDDRQQEPARFLQSRKLPWPQWYAGDSAPRPAFDTFSIRGIPSIWIVSPAGKVLVRDLHGQALLAALEKALPGN